MFLGSCSRVKVGGKWPRAACLVQELGVNHHEHVRSCRGTGCSEGFAQLSQHPSCSQLRSSSHKKDVAAPMMAPECPAATVMHWPCSTTVPALQSSSPR